MTFKYVQEHTLKRVQMLSAQTRKYNETPDKIPTNEREMFSLMFASTFSSFKEFAELGMRYLGFSLTRLQADIADFMQYGAVKKMVQAQRGQAKSTLAALYCVWRLIQNPRSRVIVVSGGEKQASDVALLVIRIIQNWNILCWMRPDITKGDRVSVSAFDVHYSLKGIDKSASVACVGITANLQGMRSDFLLADDVETQRNSMTQTERDKLNLLTKEFAAICITGEIMYLGTPQTKDSIYRTLPARGYDVRVWCGRYPTDEELARYGAGTQIAPLILEELVKDSTLQTGGGIEGDRGKPTDPEHINESILQEKELDYGSEGFALQYMLDTTLSDEMRTKIKLVDMPVIGVTSEGAPETVRYVADPSKLFDGSTLNECLRGIRMYYCSAVSDTIQTFDHKVAALDPAGAGGDELSFAIGGAVNSYIYLLSVGGFVGGCTEENINQVLVKLVEHDVRVLEIEKNMGHGTVGMLFQSQIQKLSEHCTRSPELVQKYCTELDITVHEFKTALCSIGIQEYYVTGQKERRIIDTISPVTRRHKLIVTETAIRDDWQYCQKHPQHIRKQFSAFYQLSSITYDRGSLVHDDRADCIQRVVECLKVNLAIDDEQAQEQRKEAAMADWLRNPMGYTDNDYRSVQSSSGAYRGTRRRGYR